MKVRRISPLFRRIKNGVVLTDCSVFNFNLVFILLYIFFVKRPNAQKQNAYGKDNGRKGGVEEFGNFVRRTCANQS